jgi:hypothetical protein
LIAPPPFDTIGTRDEHRTMNRRQAPIRAAKERLRRAERELDAASRRSEVNAAAARYMRAKVELRQVQAERLNG